MSCKLWYLKNARNFGDIITPEIFNFFKIPFEEVNSYLDADVISTGSIIRRAHKNLKVLGSGIISKNDKIDNRAKFIFVRGPHTKKRIVQLGGICPSLYGDPALLLPLIYQPKIKKQFKLGIIPHLIDYADFKNLDYNEDIKIIKFRTRNIFQTIDEILSCEKIMSSSLHGIITSHAYNIPAGWFIKNKLKGDNIKFFDYSDSINLKNFNASTLEKPKYFLPSSINILDIKNIFENFSTTIEAL